MGNDMPEVGAVTTIEDVHRCWKELEDEETTLAKDVKVLKNKAGLLENELQRLDVLQAQVASQQVITRQVLDVVSKAAGTASQISDRVSALDLEQARVKGCLLIVQQVSDLKKCILGIQHAMDTQDWDRAAIFLSRARKLPLIIAESRFAEMVVPCSQAPELPKVTLENAANALCGLFLRDFEKAARAKDETNVTKYFTFFP